MRYKVGVVKKITFLFMTIGLAVALVACQGAVGKTGEPGPKGEPGKPAPPAPAANLAPQARSLTFDSMRLREGGDADTVNVVSNFYDPDGDDAALVISFSVAQTARFVDVGYEAPNLTITPVDAGEAVITVTATDAGGLPASATLTVTVVDAGAPMYIGSLSGETLTFGGRQTIEGSVIESSFEGEELRFSASARPEDAMIVDVDMDNPDDPNEVTITALQTEGTATVTITATDEDGDTDSHSIQVEVRASLAPVVTDVMPDPVTLYVGGEPSMPVNVTDYFDNHGLEALTYEPTADSEAVSLSDVVDGMLTITPVSADVVVVTITATNMHGSATQTISVTVKATPPTATTGAIPAQTIAAGGSRSIALHQYFTPGKGSTHADLRYTESVEGTAATALISGGDTLVITAGSAAGSATITVTATDGDGETAMQTVMVTVTEEDVVEPPPANMPPQMKAGMTLPALRIQIVDTDPADDDSSEDTFATNDDSSADDTADNKTIELDKYFEDPDGVLVFFKVVKKAGTETLTDTTLQSKVTDNPVIDLHRTAANTTATPTVRAMGDPPDFELNVNDVTIEPLRPGSVTVMVTAKDVDGATTDAEFMVTVVAAGTNAGPEIGHTDAERATDSDTAVVFPDQVATAADTTDAAKRLKIGAAARKVIDDQNISTLFWDPNFTDTDRSESLELTVKYFPVGALASIEGTAINTNTMKELAADKVAVRPSLSASTWDGSSSAKVTFTLEGVKGTDNTSDTATDHGHLVALIATDTYGRSFAHVLRVVVNNPPNAYGAQPMEKDRTKLKDYKGFTGLVADGEIETALPLIADAAGYFSDPDGDTLMCEDNFITSEANKADDDKLFDTVTLGSNNSLVFTSNGRTGTGWIRVWCSDGIDSTPENSADATVPVSYTRGASRH